MTTPTKPAIQIKAPGFHPRDPISCGTHLFGAAAATVITILLTWKAVLNPQADRITWVSCLLFGLSLIALYTASSVYHYSNLPPERRIILRKLDHAMIFILIAGTYTPILLNYLPAPKNVSFTMFMWFFAAAGILVKLLWFSAPRWLQTALYVIMGWMILAEPAVFHLIPLPAILLIAAGGVSYTAGAVIYALKKPNTPILGFGFHEIFHLFVLLGSLLHVIAVGIYVA